MNRRDLLKASLFGGVAAPAFAQAPPASSGLGCGDCFAKEIALAMPSAPRLKVTGVKTFGVTSDALPRDRPHVFVKIETDAGVVGWGEATLEGKAGAVMQAVHDLSRLPDRPGPDAGRASLAVDVRPQLLSRRAGDGLGDFRHRPGALGHSRQGARSAGLRAARRPDRCARRARLLPPAAVLPRSALSRAGRRDPRAGREVRRHLLQDRDPRLLRVDRDTRSDRAGDRPAARAARGAGRHDRHRRRLPRQDQPGGSLHICKEVEPLNLLFVEEPCPPENVKAMAAHRRPHDRRPSRPASA